MAGQMSDLMFNIVAQDRSRAAFESANQNATGFGKKGAAAAREASKGLDSASGSVANLAAQFSDIGVQLSGGQSPLLIALQQGSQIGQVLGPMGAGGAVQALGGAFISLLSPVNLLTIGTIALGGAAFAYLSSLISDGEDAEKTLERQQELIGQVAQRWGEALPALREYADALERAEQVAQIGAATSAAASQQWAGLRDQAEEMNVEFADLLSMLQQSGAEAEGINTLQNAFSDLQQKISDGTATAEDAEQVQAALFALFQQTGIPAVDALMGSFSALAGEITSASNAAAKFNLDRLAVTGLYPSRGAYGNVPRSADGMIQGGGSQFLPIGTVPVPEGRGTPELSGFPFESIGKRQRGGRGKSEEERQAENIQKVIQSLEDEQAALGKSKTEQRVMQALRRADVDASSEQGQQIANLVAQIETEKEALRDAAEVSEFFGDALKESFTELIPEIETGNKALDSFINKLIEASAEAIFFGSGPLSSLFGSGGGLFNFGGGRAVGGGVEPWSDYLVGENGPEIVRLGSRGGRVSGADGNATGEGGGMHVTVGVSVDENGNLGAYVKDIARKEGASAASTAITRYDKTMPERVQQINRNPRKRA
ncbi:phage tail length tape measure family protein [Rhizobium giardinii]|uniref:phage tail length tape measure family protein n=1 Tax=Rhizobium giardinii TaxID=56731 RepID=UPI003D7023BA